MGNKEKKKSKKASKGRKKKRDQSSRKTSAKKLPRHEDSSNSKSDDHSLSSVSLGSYSSEEGVKGRWSRSRGRKDVKGRQKRARSSSCSTDSSSDSIRVKKGKRSKRKVGLGRRKKDAKKLRAVSLSCKSSDESDYEKSMGKSKKKGICRRNDKEDKSKRKKKRNRARNISPSSESSGSYNERKRKRYRSPSSSSSMSSEGQREGKRKRYWSPSGSSLNMSSECNDRHVQDKIEVENKPIRKLNSIIVVAATPEPGQNALSEGLEHDLDMRNDERIMKFCTIDNIDEKKSAIEAMAPVPDDEDLESVLRRKALENLKRFRGPKTAGKSDKLGIGVTGVKQLPNSENAADQENIGGSDMKQSLSSVIEPIQNESDKDRILNVNLVSSSEKEGVLASPSVNDKNISFKNHVETKTGSTKAAEHCDDNRLNLPTRADKNSNSGHDGVSRHNLIPPPGEFSNIKAESVSLLVSQEPLAASSNKELKSSPQECINATSIPSKCGTDKSSNTKANEVNPTSVGNIIKESNTINATVPDNPSSSLPASNSGELLASKYKEEAKEDSQFQEKTMTVMRGGELVQVSYKVYIPKKAPAANRRRLNR